MRRQNHTWKCNENLPEYGLLLHKVNKDTKSEKQNIFLEIHANTFE